MTESKKNPSKTAASGPEGTDELGEEELDSVAGGMIVQTSGSPSGWRGTVGGTKPPTTTTPVFDSGATLDGLKKQT